MVRYTNPCRVSRSTWACELKYKVPISFNDHKGHAPRERVSWNNTVWACIKQRQRHAPRERVSWNELDPEEFAKAQGHAPRERVSWNIINECISILENRHAPRERVSWNVMDIIFMHKKIVTLHVSVWVEILNEDVLEEHFDGHAPRERVSWNWAATLSARSWLGHAPRERVSWNPFRPHARRQFLPSRSTWACELK